MGLMHDLSTRLSSSRAEQLRTMYAGGAGNATARRFARIWSRAFGWGFMGKRWVSLEVPGRRTGRIQKLPVGMADLDGRWYLVSMLGECNWTKNLRANGGRVVLRHGRAWQVQTVEVPVAERAPILARYVEQVPGSRPHMPVQVGAPIADFEAIAPRYPAFRLERNLGRAD